MKNTHVQSSKDTARTMAAASALVAQTILGLRMIAAVSAFILIILACVIAVEDFWTVPEFLSKPLEFLAAASGYLILLIGASCWASKRLARKHAKMLVNGTTTMGLVQTVRERPKAEQIDWRADLKSALTFLSGSFRSKGRLAPSPDEADEATREKRESELREATAQAIREARIAARKTQEHLAIEADLSVRTVRRVETTGRVSFENLRSLCAALSIPLPVAEADASALKSSAWIDVAREFGWILLVLALPFQMWGCLMKSWKGRLAWLGFCTVIAAAFAWLTRWHAADSEITYLIAAGLVDLQIPYLDGVIGNYEYFYAAAILTLALAVAGTLLGLAWRSDNPRLATMAAVAGIAVAVSGGLPLLATMHDLEIRQARSDMGLKGFLALQSSIRKRAEIQPGYDVHKAIALEAVPFFYEVVLEAPVPEENLSEEAWHRKHEEMRKLSEEFLNRQKEEEQP